MIGGGSRKGCPFIENMGAGASVAALEGAVDKVVPRTPRGSLDVARCDRDALVEVVRNADDQLGARYGDAWNSYAVPDGLLAESAALARDFDPEEPPRSARNSKRFLDIGSAVSAELKRFLDIGSRAGRAARCPTARSSRTSST